MKAKASAPPSPEKVRERPLRGQGASVLAQLALLQKTVEKLVEELRGSPRSQSRQSAYPRADAMDTSRSAVRFWRAWRTGEIKALPYVTCSFAQAYSAYRTFTDRSGELPCTRSSFTHALLLASEAAGYPVRGKIMRIGPWPAIKSERMLLVTDPPERLQGAWATACSDEFGKALALYARKADRPRSPVVVTQRKKGAA